MNKPYPDYAIRSVLLIALIACPVILIAPHQFSVLTTISPLTVVLGNFIHSFSAASRRFMMRTCNGLELRDQIPPLPPEVALAAFDPGVLLDHHILNICER